MLAAHRMHGWQSVRPLWLQPRLWRMTGAPSRRASSAPTSTSSHWTPHSWPTGCVACTALPGEGCCSLVGLAQLVLSRPALPFPPRPRQGFLSAQCTLAVLPRGLPPLPLLCAALVHYGGTHELALGVVAGCAARPGSRCAPGLARVARGSNREEEEVTRSPGVLLLLLLPSPCCCVLGGSWLHYGEAPHLCLSS